MSECDLEASTVSRSWPTSHKNVVVAVAEASEAVVVVIIVSVVVN